jgi:transcriptional regulator with XRE-family HTH domain
MGDLKEEVAIGRQLAERIEQRRKALGMTQGQLAIQTGLDKSTVSSFLAGGRKDPPIGTMMRFAAALGISLDQLVGASPLPEVLPAVESAATDTRTAELEHRIQRQDHKIDHLASLVEDLAESLGRTADARILEREQKPQSRRSPKKAG